MLETAQYWMAAQRRVGCLGEVAICRAEPLTSSDYITCLSWHESPALPALPPDQVKYIVDLHPLKSWTTLCYDMLYILGSLEVESGIEQP